MTNTLRIKNVTAPVITVFAVIGALLFSVVPWATQSAGAASTKITEPSGDTYHAVLDANGAALPVTIVASGFRPGSQVFVEECDGRAPDDPTWSPTLDCDNGNAPAPAIADANGTARFSKDDRNRTFVPIVGASPGRLFNCVAPNGTPPANELTSYKKCQIRVSSNNVQATADQVFRTVVIGAGGDGSSGSSAAAVGFGLVVGFIVIGGVVVAILWFRQRRRAPVSAGSSR